LLYLAFQGEKGKIQIGNESVSLNELADLFGDKCTGVVIYFGSCETLNMDKRHIQSFMEKTGTVAVLGYKVEVDWLISASFDIRLLSYLLHNPFDSRGVQKIKEELAKDCKPFIRDLRFRMEVNERTWFKRARKPKPRV
jgi:hypothetical protein